MKINKRLKQRSCFNTLLQKVSSLSNIVFSNFCLLVGTNECSWPSAIYSVIFLPKKFGKKNHITYIHSNYFLGMLFVWKAEHRRWCHIPVILEDISTKARLMTWGTSWGSHFIWEAQTGWTEALPSTRALHSTWGSSAFCPACNR